MAFRIGRKHAQHTYPESRGLGLPPVAVQGVNATDVPFTTTAEIVVATTDPLVFSGDPKEAALITATVEYDVTGGG